MSAPAVSSASFVAASPTASASIEDAAASSASVLSRPSISGYSPPRRPRARASRVGRGRQQAGQEHHTPRSNRSPPNSAPTTSSIRPAMMTPPWCDPPRSAPPQLLRPARDGLRRQVPAGLVQPCRRHLEPLAEPLVADPAQQRRIPERVPVEVVEPHRVREVAGRTAFQVPAEVHVIRGDELRGGDLDLSGPPIRSCRGSSPRRRNAVANARRTLTRSAVQK